MVKEEGAVVVRAAAQRALTQVSSRRKVVVPAAAAAAAAQRPSLPNAILIDASFDGLWRGVWEFDGTPWTYPAVL